MDSENKYKKIFFKFIYWYLNLKKVEETFKNKGIIVLSSLNTENENQSLYFSLLNDIDISKLTISEKKYLDKIDTNDLNDEIITFIFNTYQKVLLDDSENLFIYYGYISDNYRVPGNCIALGFHYDKYGLACGNRLNLEQIKNNEKLIYDSFNYLQFNSKSKVKVAFVLYDELYKKIPDRFKR